MQQNKGQRVQTNAGLGVQKNEEQRITAECGVQNTAELRVASTVYSRIRAESAAE